MMLEEFALTRWDEPVAAALCQRAIHTVENGRIVYCPMLAFTVAPEELFLLSPSYAHRRAKNISYHLLKQRLWGVQCLTVAGRAVLQGMLARFAQCATDLIKQLLPTYANSLLLGRTSFRPVQSKGRKSSYRKDDTRLHVDAFPATPNQGWRLLRVFCNINQIGEERVWRVGEPFSAVVTYFLARLSPPWRYSAQILHWLHLTKSKRTLYDHYMLQLHHCMKADVTYQQTAPQQTISFPAGSTWITQTDVVSHAVLSGQYMLEQTFYLPVAAMCSPEQSPLRILEHAMQQSLV